MLSHTVARAAFSVILIDKYWKIPDLQIAILFLLAKITQKAGLKNDMYRSSGSMREHKKHPVDRLCFSPDYVRKNRGSFEEGLERFFVQFVNVL